MKKLFLLLALMGIVAIGCSKDEVDKGNDNKTEQPNENEGGNEETPVFEIDPEGNYVVESEGGEVLLEVTTNLEYSVYIPKDARSWLFYEETRAVRNETVVLSVEPNSDTELRTATVELRDAEGETLEHFTIVQKPYGIIEDDEPEEEDPIFESDNEGNYSITAEGGEITVTVATNIEYSVAIPADAQSWISVADTRAVRLEKIVFSVAENATMAERSAVISLLDADNELLQDFTITQGAERNITCNNNEIIYTTKYGYAIDLAITDGFGGNYVSHTFEGGYGKIIFDNDVVSIPANAFKNANSITTIMLPDTVKKIGNYTFSGCTSLTSVTIPDSVTTIGEEAFYGCSSLTSVTIGDSVTTIGKKAFYNCSSLTSVTIGDSVTDIGSYAFYGCTGELIINGKIVEVDYNYAPPTSNSGSMSGAWLAGAKFTKLTIGDNVTKIGYRSFYECSYLISVTIGDSVTSIGSSAFYGCSSLTSVTIPDSVTTIGDSAFSGCSSLTSVYITDLPAWCKIGFGGSTANPLYYAKNLYLNNELVTDLVIPSDIAEIKSYAFAHCSSLTSITIPDSVTTIGDEAFYDCSSLTSVYISDLSAWCRINFGSYDTNPLYYAKNLYLNNELVTDLVIPSDIAEIKSYAFYNCDSLESVTIPDSVTSIGDWAFAACSSLTSVTNGDSVTTIGDYAFYNCSSLTSVTIGDSVTTIGNYAFYECSSLTSVYISDIAAWCNISYSGSYSNPLNYARNLYLNNELVTDLTIPDSVTTIRYRVFYGCSSLTSITIPDSVTTIGDYAFEGCSSLTSVTIPNSVTTIGGSAFYGCSSLTSVTIPDSVTTIGNGAFKECYSLTSVTIPDSVTTIGEKTFFACSSLTSVTIPDSVTTIGYEAFESCSNLTSVYCKATTPPLVTLNSYGLWDAFDYNASGRKIYVPKESVNKYKSASYWKWYADAIVGYNF